jgi:hypothetical protein
MDDAYDGEQRSTKYLVELTRPESGWEDMQAVTARLRAAADELGELGGNVRFLRSVFVPEDESCFLIYEADSAAMASEAARRAELAVGRVQEALVLTPTAEPSVPAAR